MTLSAFRNQAGISLAEVLVAVFLIGIGLTGLLSAAPVGVAGMETGRQQSTALFLAQDKLERIKAWSLSNAAAPAQQGFGTIVAGGSCFTVGAGPCAADGYGTIPGYNRYRRVVTATPDPATPAPPNHTRTVVTIQVFYQPVSAQGVSATERQVAVSTMLALR
ncbi:MAG TPA: prepilin-type N-terminal cleavage/methylation domain-containing protein [Methylomirabilota bacterium]|nr:prepilin-type N-terminal cleavage/methylation domain-containing protein [Methylomirabilota bacterium]